MDGLTDFVKRRRWVVDASNVMGSRPDGWWRDRTGALLRLLDEVIRWQQVTGEAVSFVIDGYPSHALPEGSHYGVEVGFANSRDRDAADDEIVRIVERNERGEKLRVVTSDRDLRRRVEAFGIETEGAAHFLTRIADIEPRRSDRAVLAYFGVDESALLGKGGEARVFAIDAERVLRLPHAGAKADLEARRDLLLAIGGSDDFAVPEVLDHREVEGRTVVIERRLPGRSALEVLAEPNTDRALLIRSHLDVANRIAELPCPIDQYGERYGDSATTAASFRDWSVSRLKASLRLAGVDFQHVDPMKLTDELINALPTRAADPPKLVHLDAFLGNMLAERSRITALLDFGPMTIAGPFHLDPLVSIAYLAPEITPTADADDRAVARSWARDHQLLDAVEPAERWIAAYWTCALGDPQLRRWCARILQRPRAGNEPGERSLDTSPRSARRGVQ